MKISSVVPQMHSRPWWVPARRFDAEMMDCEQPIDDLRKNFQDIEFINRYFGGWSAVLKHVSPFLEAGSESSVLDVATGGADVPRALLRWSRKRGNRISMTALDCNPSVLDIARDVCRGEALISFTMGDACDLPFASDSFDCVLLSLTLHHFDDALASRVLQEMMRVAKRGVIVNDLNRGYLPAGLIWLTTRLLGMNRMTKNDAPLSVLRARTLAEYRALARSAGLSNVRIYRHAFWRVALVATKSRSSEDRSIPSSRSS